MKFTTLDQIKGQESAKRAIEVAAVGNHTLKILPNSISNDGELVALMYKLAGEKFGIRTEIINDMVIELSKDSVSDILSKHIVYPIDEISKNVGKALDFLPKVKDAIDDRSNELLRLGISKLNMTQLDIVRVIEVSKSIAALAGSEKIKPEHISEAMQYNQKTHEEQK